MKFLSLLIGFGFILFSIITPHFYNMSGVSAVQATQVYSEAIMYALQGCGFLLAGILLGQNAISSTENVASMINPNKNTKTDSSVINSQKRIKQRSPIQNSPQHPKKKSSTEKKSVIANQEKTSILAQMGENDTRPPLGLSVDGVPEIDWMDIPAGQFLYGDSKEERDILHDYKISKYPTTYAQFQAFIDAPDGLNSDAHNWFEGLHTKATQMRLVEQTWKYNNHPRDSVNWYQAMAFCRWLSYKLGGSYDLEDVE